MGDFNAHVKNDSLTWKGVIGSHRDADFDSNARLFASSGLTITNTFFKHKDCHNMPRKAKLRAIISDRFYNRLQI